MNRVHIIAEAGVNHNGSLTIAKELIDVATRAGADSVKWQIINPWGLYLPGKYKYGHYDIEKVIEMRFSTVLKDSEYEEIFKYAKSSGILCSASVFDLDGLTLLQRFNPPYIKTASCDLNNIRFLREVARTGLKMIISTGMSTLADIEKAVKAVVNEGAKDFVLLHCVSIYPSKLDQTNLSFLLELKNNFGVPVGFSDHTKDSKAACIAIALGAEWLEKHYTIDNKLEGFDHAHAQTPTELECYISDVRAAELSLSASHTKILEAESYTRKRARRSLYAARNLPPHHILTDEDVLIVRPEGLMDADQIDGLIGRKLVHGMSKYEPFHPDYLA